MADESANSPSTTGGPRAAQREMSENEATFRRLVEYNVGVLWTLGAVEETLAALWEVVTKAAGPQGLRAALLSRSEDRP